MADTASSQDPVREQRAKIQRLVTAALRTGYGSYLVALLVFFIAYFSGPTPLMTNTIIVLLVFGGVLLAPALVFKYGIKAAEREDRAAGL